MNDRAKSPLPARSQISISVNRYLPPNTHKRRYRAIRLYCFLKNWIVDSERCRATLSQEIMMKKLSLLTALSLPLLSPANSEKFMGGAAGPGNGAWDHPPGSLADLPIHHHGLFGRMLSVRRTIFCHSYIRYSQTRVYIRT